MTEAYKPEFGDDDWDELTRRYGGEPDAQILMRVHADRELWRNRDTLMRMADGQWDVNKAMYVLTDHFCPRGILEEALTAYPGEPFPFAVIAAGHEHGEDDGRFAQARAWQEYRDNQGVRGTDDGRERFEREHPREQYPKTFNLVDHVDDHPDCVAFNLNLLKALGTLPLYTPEDNTKAMRVVGRLHSHKPTYHHDPASSDVERMLIWAAFTGTYDDRLVDVEPGDYQKLIDYSTKRFGGQHDH